ncbi:unnamed protein product [Caenorhabditis nigoni]|uniref:Homeobox domain-containing protein n=1 Tax=Caenorhabditis nigoni TaxID=1611254 RepID=A0A2G5SFD9_9PELO|nr:hypothetical protein B9Z55_027550 [Caenorhabditis nigoni]
MVIVNWVLPKKKASIKAKKRLLKYTEVQKNTLNAIFEVTEKPPCETIEIISENLNLEFKTVLNYLNRNRQSQLDLQRQQMQN